MISHLFSIHCKRGLLRSVTTTTPLLVLLLLTSTTAHGNRSPIPPPPALQNMGNTCYLNAQIQCAYHIPQVRQIVLSKENEKPQPTAHTALRELFQDMDHIQSSSPSSTTVSPRQFCQALGIPIWQQQDSQEFWKLLLPALQLPNLSDLYQGAYQDYIVALDGSQREKRKEEAFLDISLDVQPTLQEALAQLVRPELLKATEGNGWRPEKGAPAVDAHKGIQLQAQTLPPVLQLHLKRFQFDWNTETTTKINAPCHFPVVLNLKQFCGLSSAASSQDHDNDDANVWYDLQGIVVHAGEYGQGHYYAYVRPDIQSNTWYRCNDDVIEQVDVKHVLCDSYGGQHRLSDLYPDSSSSSSSEGDDDSSQAATIDSNQQSEKETKTPGFWTRWARKCFGARVSQNTDSSSSPSYGYGGPTSSAYVLQYVRRTAVPTLYGAIDSQI